MRISSLASVAPVTPAGIRPPAPLSLMPGVHSDRRPHLELPNADGPRRRSLAAWLGTAALAILVAVIAYVVTAGRGDADPVSADRPSISRSAAPTNRPTANATSTANATGGVTPATRQSVAADLADAWAWLRDNTAPGTRVLVSADQLAAATAALPGRAVVTDPRASAGPPELVLAPSTDVAKVSVGLATRPVAVFGTIQVAQTTSSRSLAASRRAP